jgi:hypothetical protein
MSYIKGFVLRKLKPLLSTFLKEDSINEDLLRFESLGHISLNNVVGSLNWAFGTGETGCNAVRRAGIESVAGR